MDQETLRKDIETIVANIFSEKEEKDMRKRTEDALQEAATTIEELTASLEEKNTESEDLASKILEHEEKATNLETELEAAKQEVESFKTQLEEAENALEEIKKDRAADVRMAELEEAGIARKEEEARANQIAKVREMSDEEYAAYRDELTAVRQAVLDEIAAASEENKETTEVVEEKEEGSEEEVEEEEEVASEEEAVNEENSGEEEASEEDEGEDDTPPVNIDPNKAVSAALNLDTKLSEDILSKYAALGKAMAEQLKK